MQIPEAFREIANQSWLGTGVGLIGLIAGYVFYRNSNIGPRPVFQSRALNLIGKGHPALPEDIEIIFQRQSVERLTKTYVIVWNSGRANGRWKEHRYG